MQIVEKPIQKEDWSQDVSCSQCLAKLSVNASDVSFIESHLEYVGPNYERYDDAYLVSCLVCKKTIPVSPIWSVQEFAKAKREKVLNQQRSFARAVAEAEVYERNARTYAFATIVVLASVIMASLISFKSLIMSALVSLKRYNPIMPW